MISRQLLVTVTACLLLAAPVFGQSAVLDMNTSPVLQGWSQSFFGGGSASLGGGVLTLTAPVNGASAYMAPAALWAAAVADPSGWEIEADVRVTNASNPAQGAVMVFFRTGVHYCIAEIFTDHIALYGSWSGTTSWVMDTTDQVHQYILSGVGTLVEIRVDGNLVISANNLTPDTLPAELGFGDGAWANATTSDWTYVAFGPLGAVATEQTSWGEVKSLFR